MTGIINIIHRKKMKERNKKERRKKNEKKEKGIRGK